MMERFFYPLLWRHIVKHVKTQKQLTGKREVSNKDWKNIL